MMDVTMYAGRTTAILADQSHATLATLAIPAIHAVPVRADRKDRKDLSQEDRSVQNQKKTRLSVLTESLACFLWLLKHHIINSGAVQFRCIHELFDLRSLFCGN